MSRNVPLKGEVALPAKDNGPRLAKAAIGIVGPDGVIDIPPEGVFLLNPESWEENKASNWTPNQINGQSDPILQWTGGGPRMLTFDALVTRDSSDFLRKSGVDIGGAIKDAAIQAVGSIASNFFGVNVPPLGDLFGPKKGAGTDLSISDYLNFYRSLAYPVYNASDRRLTQSPPLLVLYVGSSLQNEATEIGLKGSHTSPNYHLWVLTNYRIRVTKQLLNLDPMEAIVSFQLMEYVIQSKDQSTFRLGNTKSLGLGDFNVSSIFGGFV